MAPDAKGWDDRRSRPHELVLIQADAEVRLAMIGPTRLNPWGRLPMLGACG